MVEYCEGSGCRRRKILKSFGEQVLQCMVLHAYILLGHFLSMLVLKLKLLQIYFFIY